MVDSDGRKGREYYKRNGRASFIHSFIRAARFGCDTILLGETNVVVFSGVDGRRVGCLRARARLRGTVFLSEDGTRGVKGAESPREG